MPSLTSEVWAPGWALAPCSCMGWDAGAGGQGKIFTPGMDAGRTSPQIGAKLQMLTYPF